MSSILALPFVGLFKPARSVLVLGAGLSGLSVAYELALRGYKVTVIEARDYAGGRVFTLRKPFLNNQYVELGGELIGDGYKRFLKYAKDFSIEFEENQNPVETGGSVANPQRGITSSAILKGRLFAVGTILNENPYGLPEKETMDLPPAILFRHIASVVSELRTNPSKIFDYDRLSLADFLRKRGVSEQMIKLMNISLNYNSIETVSMGGVLWDAVRRVSAGTKPIQIIGGNDRITKALFENSVRLGVKFIFQAEVKRISQNPSSVRVSFLKNGKVETVEADKIVCTIPFSVLREIIFEPNLPESKAKAINELAYTRITKVFLQAERAAWDERNLGAAIWTDTPCERIFNSAGKKGDKFGIFTIWTEGAGAEIPESMNDRERIVWGQREFVKALPFMKGRIQRRATKSWTLDKYARGAYAHFKVGQLASLQPFLKTPVGRIHFAGEHTAEKMPGMEGALESAERVVAEIDSGG
ncbi:MAG: amine oxidase [Pyrinomonadaceae bacterium]|nr:MAG: amine oxidase [Pyrinomonadaceae bacterium]